MYPLFVFVITELHQLLVTGLLCNTITIGATARQIYAFVLTCEDWLPTEGRARQAACLEGLLLLGINVRCPDIIVGVIGSL